MEIHTEVKSELNKTLLRICVPGITEADYQTRNLIFVYSHFSLTAYSNRQHSFYLIHL